MNNKKQQNTEGLVEEVIKYKIRKNGNCGLKLIFKTLAGEFYKDEYITSFDGSLLETCTSLVKHHSGTTIGVDGVYNSEDNTFRQKGCLLFKSGIAAASLEYIETLDYKNPSLEPDVKLCIMTSIINSRCSKSLLDPDAFGFMVGAVKGLKDLDNKTDLKNTLAVLEFMSGNIKNYVCKDSDALKATGSAKDKVGVSSALANLDDLVSKYERIDNNDLIMSIYRVIKSVKALEV